MIILNWCRIRQQIDFVRVFNISNSTYNYDTILLIMLCNDGCSYEEVITINNRFYVVSSASKLTAAALNVGVCTTKYYAKVAARNRSKPKKEE